MNSYRKIIQIFRKTRAVSPVIAAILLIGLAVLAGAAVAFIVLPLVAGSADVQLSTMSATDTNSDGKVDKITLTFINPGIAGAEVSNIDLAGMTNWAVTSPTGGTAEISPSSLGVDFDLKPTTVLAQLNPTDDISIDVFVDGAPDASFQIDRNFQAEDGNSFAASASVKNIADADLVIKTYTEYVTFTDSHASQGIVDDGDVNNANRETGTGSPGIRFITSRNNANIMFYNSDQAQGTAYATGTNPASETTTWDITTNSVVGFWIKSDVNFVNGGNQGLRVYFTAFQGGTRAGDFYYNLEPLLDGALANEWVLVTLDFNELGIWSGRTGDELSATVMGGFGIWIDNNFQNSWDIYVDDIFVAGGLGF